MKPVKFAVLDYLAQRTVAVCNSLRSARTYVKVRRNLFGDYRAYQIMRGTSALDWIEVEVKG